MILMIFLSIMHICFNSEMGQKGKVLPCSLSNDALALTLSKYVTFSVRARHSAMIGKFSKTVFLSVTEFHKALLHAGNGCLAAIHSQDRHLVDKE